ncbi:MAG: hypothetical protein HFH31_00055 [Bacilli bacterium]|nr:hypothetical protein [Bacilli bacterium]
METRQISEQEEERLKNEIEELRGRIREVRKDRRDFHSVETGLFKAPDIGSILFDIVRWEKRIEEIRHILNHSTVIKINMDSDIMKVEVGDLVAGEIIYEGREPKNMKFMLDGPKELPGVKNISLTSPIGMAILGKEIGEHFSSVVDAKQYSFEGIITGIVKAKDLEQLETSEPLEKGKAPYILK